MGRSDTTNTSDSILITGFGPFPGVSENISGPLAEAAATEANSDTSLTFDYKVHHLILPTEWKAGPDQLTNALDTIKPSIVLHLGVSEKASGFIIETQSHNTCRQAPDAVAEHPQSTQLCDNSPSVLDVTFPVDQILLSLANMGLPVSRSADAGGYLCNAVLFTTLKRVTTALITAGFVHIPSAPDTTGLTKEQLLLGVMDILRCCALHHKTRCSQ